MSRRKYLDRSPSEKDFFLKLDGHATRKWCVPFFISTLNNIWTSLHEPLEPVMYDLCGLEKDAEYLMNEIDKDKSRSIEAEEISFYY